MKDLRSGIKELKTLLDSFEKKNKKLASNQAHKKSSQMSHREKNKVPLLTASNFEEICGEKTSVCIIGVFGSNKAKGQLEAVLSEVCVSCRRSCMIIDGRYTFSYSSA